jgi:RNA polymerase sigma-70 factor, ECF subfamily
MQPIEDLASTFLSQRHLLLRYLHYLVDDRHMVEDIFQEVWLALATAVKQGVEIENVSAWCRGVARHKVLDYYRSKRHLEVVSTELLLDLMGDISGVLDATHESAMVRKEALERCVEKLPRRGQTALQLRYEQGMTLGQVGEQMQMNLAAITKYLYRLRRTLETCVGEASHS